MLHRRAVLGTPKCEKSVGRRGSAPDPAGGAYSAPPGPLAGGGGRLREGFAAHLLKNPTYNIVIALVLCVCTDVYDKKLSCRRETARQLHTSFIHSFIHSFALSKMHCYFLLNVKHGASLQLYLGGGPPTI